MSRRVCGSFGGRIAGASIWEWPKLVFVVGVVTFNRKSCVTAIPMEAKAREVRIHARNVRSGGVSDSSNGGFDGRDHCIPRAR